MRVSVQISMIRVTAVYPPSEPAASNVQMQLRLPSSQIGLRGKRTLNEKCSLAEKGKGAPPRADEVASNLAGNWTCDWKFQMRLQQVPSRLTWSQILIASCHDQISESDWLGRKDECRTSKSPSRTKNIQSTKSWSLSTTVSLTNQLQQKVSYRTPPLLPSNIQFQHLSQSPRPRPCRYSVHVLICSWYAADRWSITAPPCRLRLAWLVVALCNSRLPAVPVS